MNGVYVRGKYFSCISGEWTEERRDSLNIEGTEAKEKKNTVNITLQGMAQNQQNSYHLRTKSVVYTSLCLSPSLTYITSENSGL